VQNMWTRNERGPPPRLIRMTSNI